MKTFLDWNVGSSVPNVSTVRKQVRIQRQSSMDEQIFEEWQTARSDFKVHKDLP